MLRKIRITLAAISFICIMLLFLDFTGTVHSYLGWMAKIQLIPAVLSVNFIVIVTLIILTLIFGRVYCSVICPLGIMQDIISWLCETRGKKYRYRFTYSKPRKFLRYPFLALFVLALVLGAGEIAALLEPYSTFGRICSNFFAPIYQGVNNILAFFAKRLDSYAFYSTEIWIKSISTFILSGVTLAIIFVLAWRNGRTVCNSVCPVGTTLGFLSKFSIFRVVIDENKCVDCGLCAKQCKSACLDSVEHKIDYSRCVVCMNCIDSCKKGAIKYVPAFKTGIHKEISPDEGRRKFLTVSAIMGSSAIMEATKKKVDGGLAPIVDKIAPKRTEHLVPPGAESHENLNTNCTACQLCISVCPNKVLRPSTELDNFMQPHMSYEKGYCRPECTKCSEVCPTGAINKITKEEKSAIQIGKAVVILDNCVVNTDGVSCGNCARHCPVGAISLVRKNPEDKQSLRIPSVNPERCIGCGACENLCPSRPFSAIYVEGYQVHRTN